MTGRGGGYCVGYPTLGYLNPAVTGGYRGRAAWGGRGYRHRYYATGLPGWVRASQGLPVRGIPPYVTEMTALEEMEMLSTQAKELEQTLEEIKKRMAEVEKAKLRD
jgi:hypothetical protein